MIINQYGCPLTSSELRAICIKYDLFTCGDIDQYNKLFDMLNNGATLNEIAAVIWVCSRIESISAVVRLLNVEGVNEAKYILRSRRVRGGALSLETAQKMADEAVRLDGEFSVDILDNSGRCLESVISNAIIPFQRT